MDVEHEQAIAQITHQRKAPAGGGPSHVFGPSKAVDGRADAVTGRERDSHGGSANYNPANRDRPRHAGFGAGRAPSPPSNRPSSNRLKAYRTEICQRISPRGDDHGHRPMASWKRFAESG